MKKFVFRYQRILDVRIATENEIKNSLGKINRDIMDKESELSLAKENSSAYLKTVETMMQNGVRAADLRAVERYKENLKNAIMDLMNQLNILMNERIEIQNELVEANKQRKIMEKLKEKELANYKELEAVEDAKLTDEIVTYTSSKKGGI